MHTAAFRCSVMTLALLTGTAAGALGAQAAETYDLLQFKAPAWTRTSGGDNVQFSTHRGRAACRIAVYASTAGSDVPLADFTADWNDLGRGRSLPDVATVAPVSTPFGSGFTRLDGMGQATMAPVGQFTTRQITITGHRKRTSVIAMYNDATFCEPAIEEFLGSITLGATAVSQLAGGSTGGGSGTRPASRSGGGTPPAPPTPAEAPAAGPSTFAFSTTNWDDGWTSTIGETFTTVSKGDLRVLLHYRRPEDGEYMSVIREKTARFWDLLVAPRYSSASGLYIEAVNIGDFESGHYAAATAVEKGTGRSVYVVLFLKKAGNNPWMEFISPDKATFEREWGPYLRENTDFKRWLYLAGRNQFAVSARDFSGTWSDNFSSATAMVYASTGRSAGMLYAGGSTEMTFDRGTYTEETSGGSGMTGSIKWQVQRFKGPLAVVDNWTVTMANNFAGETRRYHASFEGVIGGRILNLNKVGPGAALSYHLVRVK